MSGISRVNLQIGLHNEKVQDVVHQWRRLAGGTLVLQAGDRGRGKGRGDASGQGNECLRVCFYLRVRCDTGVSSCILSVI